MALESGRVISGTYGECICDGNWLMNVFKMTAEVEVQKEDVKRSGTRWTGKKVVALAGTGSITGYKVTSELLENVGSIMDDRKSEFRTELISKLDDPEAWGAERIRLKGVSFDKIPVVGWEVGALIEEEWSFTFEGYELLDKITQS